MMCVEGGAFMMGAADNDTEAEADECPRHKVTLSDFLIGETEVTQELWTAVMGSNPSYTKGDKLPVERVSFYDSQEFISKLNALIGLYFRLPTEAEWEYAARGGKKSHRYRYAGSNNIDQVAWTPENSGNKTHVVAEKLPNELGIYDMTGNVWEFCLDWYGEYLEENQINPIESITRNYYVCRGCAAFGNSGYSNENYFRITNRGIAWPDYQYNNVGFRLVLDAHQYVDLGLSVKWATCNVGATAPEEYGDYFAWGETEPKETYSWETYKWCDGTKQNITKYNAEDGLMNLLPEDDAAHANWGGQWRMPTAAEQAELLEYCIWEKMTVNGVIGSKVTGPNGNSIFIPLGGSYNTFDNQLNSVGQHGWIYSSTKSSADNKAREMSLSSNGGTQTICSRCIGLNIRPVILTDREPLPPITPAKRIGVFSVAKDRQVSFAQGNLQYVNSRREWRFADNQWDYLCEKNTEGKYIDLFDWTADASGSFFDWGQYEIQGDTVKTWRTLTIDEWKYLLHDRPRATELLGAATVNGVVGLVVLPDDWQLPEEVDFVSVSQENHVWKEGEKLYRFYEDIYLHNVFTSSSWQLMEQAGAVFLPASGYINGSGNLMSCGKVARMWSSTPHNYAKGYYISFNVDEDASTHRIRTYSRVNSDKGHSVRLVHDTIVPFEPEYVDLGLSVKWATCNVGATAPEEYGDYFAWGEVEPKNEYSWATYKWCDGTVNTITKYNAEDGLTTLLPEDDAAHVNWGGQWRMPSVAEMTELREKCTWTWTSQNGVNGYKVTGPNGNSIFLPAAGYEWDENEEGGGSYWCNMNNGQTVAYCLRFTEKSIESRRGLMCCGVPIRPVLSKTSKTYYYSLTDEQFNTATSIWNMPNRGWGIADQTPIQGRVLHGIRLKVHTPGVLHIYKVPSLTETTEENFVKVATVTASATGLQDIDFAQPFYLGENEYLVIGSPVDDSGLVGYFSAGETTLQPFYNRVGQSGGGKIAQSLMIDFY